MKESSTSKAAGRSPDQTFTFCLTKNSVNPILGQSYPVDNLASWFCRIPSIHCSPSRSSDSVICRYEQYWHSWL